MEGYILFFSMPTSEGAIKYFEFNAIPINGVDVVKTALNFQKYTLLRKRFSKDFTSLYRNDALSVSNGYFVNVSNRPQFELN